jgi:hypothetical protein
LPSEENATAKQCYECRPPTAYNLLPSAGTLTHAFASYSTRTQAHFLETRMLDCCTASRILPVVYATESGGLYVLTAFSELMLSPN